MLQAFRLGSLAKVDRYLFLGGLIDILIVVEVLLGEEVNLDLSLLIVFALIHDCPYMK